MSAKAYLARIVIPAFEAPPFPAFCGGRRSNIVCRTVSGVFYPEKIGFVRQNQVNFSPPANCRVEANKGLISFGLPKIGFALERPPGLPSCPPER